MSVNESNLPSDTTESMAVTLHIISGRGILWPEERERDLFRSMARVLLDPQSHSARKLREAWDSAEQPKDAAEHVTFPAIRDGKNLWVCSGCDLTWPERMMNAAIHHANEHPPQGIKQAEDDTTRNDLRHILLEAHAMLACLPEIDFVEQRRLFAETWEGYGFAR